MDNQNLYELLHDNNVLGDGFALVIVPPFVSTERPSLGPHVLQAYAREAGFEVRVLYANFMLAAQLGDRLYESLCEGKTSHPLAGERVFAPIAYANGELIDGDGTNDQAHHRRRSYRFPEQLDAPENESFFRRIKAWTDSLAEAVAGREFKVVGCTSSFDQNAASFAILKAVKKIDPQLVTILGGGNCEDEMGEGIVALNTSVDFVFAGESETVFVDFLKAIAAGNPPGQRLVRGKPCMDLDALPAPDFSEYFTQKRAFLSAGREAAEKTYILYETSRGCWWGQKHHCTFCGLNGLGMISRQKSPDKIVAELKTLVERHGTKRVFMADNLMPYDYFHSLLPRLAGELPGLSLFYEQKSNLSLDKVLALKRAGVDYIQAGIESLATPLLKRMDKGVSGAQNIALLRYARAAGVRVAWNLLYGFPQDEIEEYETTLRLIPLLRHLQPPIGVHHLSIDRFSPYFDRPQEYGITNLRPLKGHESVYPREADIAKIAYHFTADYQSASRSNPLLIDGIKSRVNDWLERWSVADGQAPNFHVKQMSPQVFLICDTRGLADTEHLRFVDADEASYALVARRRPGLASHAEALKLNYGIDLYGRYVPLATAEPELIRDFDARFRSRAASPAPSADTPPASMKLEPASFVLSNGREAGE